MKPAKQDSQEARQDQAPGKAQGKARQRRRSITVRLSRKVKLIYTWRARHRLPRLLLRLLTQAFASLLAGFTGHALAAPDGGTVASGSASISKPTTYQTIVKQDTPRAVINWNSYNVAAGERVTYQQPTASSVTLNRVTGGDLSKIYGSIDANGVVVISNPAGVYFGQGAQVNVGGLVAGAMAISDADFNAGNYRFTGNGSGSVKNEGNIQAGAYGVALIGHTVDNSGRIESGGAVLMGAGGQATLKLANDRLVDIAVDSSAVQAQVSNTGVIHADGGNIVLSARATDALLDTVLLAGGEMRADSLREVNGKIVLDGGSSGVVKVDGTLQARGLNANEKGGEVKVTGERVLLASNSLIDVSGQAGGGQVHVGGGYQGQDPTIAHATDVTMEKGTAIRADATHKGDGGEVVLWSDHSTIFAGEISAKGGVEGGDGGRVETSGKYLRSTGMVNASAAKGEAGSWLLDPYNIWIANVLPSGYTNDNGNIVANADSAFVDASVISNALTAGTNVTVSTGTGGNQAGDILLSASIDSYSATRTSLTLKAAGKIDVDQNGRIVAQSGPLDVSLQAGSSINMDLNASVATKGGSFEASGGSAQLANVNTGGGNITVTANNGNASLVDVQTGSQLTGRGSLNVNANVITLSRTEAGDMNLTAQQRIRQTNKVTATGKTILSVTNVDGDVLLGNTNNDFRDSVKIAQAQNATIANSGALQIEGSVTGDLNVTANGSITQSNALSVEGTSALQANGNDITLNSIANHFKGTVSIQNAHSVSIVSDSLQIEGTASGDLTAAALSGSLTQSGALTVGGQSNLAAYQDIDLQSAANSFTGPVHLETTVGNASLANNRDLMLSGTIGNDLLLTTQGKTTLGQLTVNGSLVAASSNGFEQTGAALAVFKSATFDGAIINPFDTITPVANSNILLTGASNDFRDAVVLRHAADVSINNSGALQLEGTISGNLNVVAGGPINQSNALSVTGNSLFQASGSDITLTNAANNFQGDMTVSDARNVGIVNGTKLMFDGHVSGDLNIDAKGIGQSSAIEVEGKATLKAGSDNDIQLSDAGNRFSSVDIQSARDTTISSIALQLEGTVSRNLTAAATAGSLTQSGALKVDGQSAFTARDDITLKNLANNFTGAVDLETTVGNASLYNTGATAISGSVKGDLDVTAQGSISQGARKLDIGGMTTLKVENGGILSSIFLGNADNAFAGRVKFDGAFNTALVSGGPIQIEGNSGTLSVTAAGDITQSGSVNATSFSRFDAGANNVTLADASNNFGDTVTLVNAKDVTLHGANGLKLQGTVTGDLTASTGESLTQEGALSVNGKSIFTARDNIYLNNTSNSLAGPVHLETTLGEAQVYNNGDLTLTANVATELAAAATGAITQGAGSVVVSGYAAIAANGVDLGGAGNQFRGLNVASSGGAVVAGRITENLDVSATGISQRENALTVGAATSLYAQSGDITLTHSDNGFTGRVLFGTSGSVNIRSKSALQLEGWADGNLTVEAGGSITQSASITAQNVQLTTTGANHDITLDLLSDGENNEFKGTVQFNATRDVTLANSGALKVSGEAGGNLSLTTSTGAITQTGILKAGGTTTVTTQGQGDQIQLSNAGNNFIGDLTLNSAGAAEIAGHVGGKLDVTANGNITQGTNPLKVDGESKLTVSGAQGDITLDQDSNVFSQKLAFSGPGKVKIFGSNDLILEGSAGDTLDVKSAGSIGQSAKLSSGSTATFTSTGTGISVNLADLANDFAGATNISSAGSVRLGGHFGDSLKVESDTGNVSMGGTVANGLEVTAGRSIYLDVAPISVTNGATILTAGQAGVGTTSISLPEGGVFGGDLTLAGSYLAIVAGHVKGDLKITSAGNVTQGGALTVDHKSTLFVDNNPSGKITLSDSNNVFAEGVSFSAADKVKLASAGPLQLEGTAGSLEVNAAGSITQGNALTVTTGPASFTTTGANHNITLANDGNVFNGDVALNSAGNANLHAKGDVKLSGAIAHDLTVAAVDGSILQTDGPTMDVGGKSSFTTTSSQGNTRATDIQFTNSANVFGDAIALNSAGDARIWAKSDVKLSGSVARDLDARVIGGSILQGDGAVKVMRDTYLQTRADSGNPTAVTDIILENPNNAFMGQLGVNSAGKVAIKGKGDVKLSGGAIGNLKAEAIDGSLLQGDRSLYVGGASELTTTSSPGNSRATDIVFDDLNNKFEGAVTLNTDGKASLAGSLNLSVGGRVGQDFFAKSIDGFIVQGSSPLTVGGSSTFSTSNSPGNTNATGIVLDNPDNSFGGAVSLDTGGKVILAAKGDLLLGGAVGDTLSATATGGSIKQGDSALQVTNGSSLSTVATNNGQPADVELNNPANSFGGPVALDVAGNASLAAAGNVTVNGKVVGELAVKASGDIGQNAALEVDGTTKLAAGGNISLGNAQNDFKDTVTVEKAVNVEIKDSNALDTQGTATGNVVLTANDDLTQSGAWQVEGTSTLTSQNGNVEFNNPNNQFAGVVTPTAPNNVDLSAQTPVTVAPNAGGDVSVNAPQVSVVGGSVGGNLNTTGKTYLSNGVVVVGANGPAILQNAVQLAVTASLSPLNETGPGSYRNYLLLANPPVILQNSVLPSVEGSGILLPDDEKKREVSSQ